MLHLALRLINYAIWVVELIVIASTITRWMKLDGTNPIVATLRSIADPICEPARVISRKISDSVDWSPAIVILTLEIIRRFVL